MDLNPETKPFVPSTENGSSSQGLDPTTQSSTADSHIQDTTQLSTSSFPPNPNTNLPSASSTDPTLPSPIPDSSQPNTSSASAPSTTTSHNPTTNQTTDTSGEFTVLLFASAQSYTNHSSITLSAPMPLSKLYPTLEEKFPGIGRKVLDSAAVTVNLEYVDVEADGELVIGMGDEVGIIPPVSSG